MGGDPKFRELIQMLELVTPEGERTQLVITSFDDSSVTLDGNHPLAGCDLTFAIKLVEIV